MIGVVKLRLFCLFLLCGFVLHVPLSFASERFWFPPVTVDQNGASFFSPPSVGVDGQGNAIYIFANQPAVGNSVIKASQLPFDGGWTEPEVISDPNRMISSFVVPRVAVNSSGMAVAIWGSVLIDIPTAIEIRASRFIPGQGWSAPVIVAPEGFNLAPSVGIDPLGNAVIAWANFDVERIQAAQLIDGLPTATIDVSAMGSLPETAVEVGVDAAGNAIVVWGESLLPLITVQAAHFTFGQGWSAPILLSNPANIAIQPSVGVDPAGNAVAIWRERNGAVFIQASTFPVGGSWSAAMTISPIVPITTLAFSKVRVDTAGNAVAIWRNSAGSPEIQVATLPFGGVWTAPVTISQPSVDVTTPMVGVGPGGDAVAVWRQSNGVQVIQASNLPFGATMWSEPVDISSPGIDALFPNVAVDPFGNAVAVWINTNATTTNQAAVFQKGPFVPLNLRAKQVQDRFPTQAELVNVLKWDANPEGKLAVFYEVYRDDLNNPIGKVFAEKTLEFEDHNQSKCKVTYFVRAFDKKGKGGPFAEVILMPCT